MQGHAYISFRISSFAINFTINSRLINRYEKSEGSYLATGSDIIILLLINNKKGYFIIIFLLNFYYYSFFTNIFL